MVFFSNIWKRTRIVIFPKSVKLSRTHINDIHCVSLIPCLRKCLEKLCTTRLNHFIRKSHILSDDQYDQYGFTPQRSAEDALVHLCHTIQQGKHKNPVTFLILLDIRGVFDNVWWPGILQLFKCFRISFALFRASYRVDLLILRWIVSQKILF